MALLSILINLLLSLYLSMQRKLSAQLHLMLLVEFQSRSTSLVCLCHSIWLHFHSEVYSESDVVLDLSHQCTFLDAAILSRVFPVAIPSNGHVMVELRGSNLFQSNLMAVRLDGAKLVPSPDLFWESPIALRFLAPPHTAGYTLIDFSYNQISTDFSNALSIEYLGLFIFLFSPTSIGVLQPW